MSHITRSGQDDYCFDTNDNFEDEINNDNIFSYDDLYDDDDFYEEDFLDDSDEAEDDYDDCEPGVANINYDKQAYEHACKFKEPV